MRALPAFILVVSLAAGCVDSGTPAEGAATDAAPTADAPSGADEPGAAPASPEPEAAPASAEASPDPAGFLPPVAATTACGGACFETTVATDPAGRIFAMGARTGDIGVSSDGGQTFESVPSPPIPGGLPGSPGQSDAILQVGPTGALYYSALVRAAPDVFVGLQVAISDDGARTWRANLMLSPATPPGITLAPDRQWLGFGADGVVYLAYNQRPSGVWVARSDDGGETWGPFVDAAPPALRGGAFGQAGPPVVDAGGRVYVPATSFDGPIRIFWSDDGVVWRWSDAVGEAGRAGAWFPILAVGADGTLHLATWYAGAPYALAFVGEDDSVLLVSSSRDRGATWSAPVEWGRNVAAGPWILSEGSGMAVAWYRAAGSMRELVLARGDASGLVEEVVAQGGLAEGARGANTDFAHAAFLPDGRAVVVWSHPDGEAMVQVEARPPA